MGGGRKSSTLSSSNPVLGSPKLFHCNAKNNSIRPTVSTKPPSDSTDALSRARRSHLKSFGATTPKTRLRKTAVMDALPPSLPRNVSEFYKSTADLLQFLCLSRAPPFPPKQARLQPARNIKGNYAKSNQGSLPDQ